MDKSGTMSSYELRMALESAGEFIRLSIMISTYSCPSRAEAGSDAALEKSTGFRAMNYSNT